MKKITVFLFILVSELSCFAQWESDVRLTDNPFTSSNYSKHGIASTGDTVHVVWYDDRDGNYEIYYKRSLDGSQTWGEDTRLTFTPFRSMNVSIAVSGSVVHIVYEDESDGNFEAYYKRSLDRGDTWEDDIRITETPGMTQGIGLSASGSMVYIVYYDYIEDWWNIFFNRSTDGGLNWESSVQLTVNPAISGNPSVFAIGSLVYVVWDEDWGNNSEIYFKRSVDFGMNWEEATQLTIDDGYESSVPCVAASGSDVYMVWMDNRHGAIGFDDEIYFKHSPDEGITWENDTRITNYQGESEYPTMTVADEGIFIVWRDDRLGNFEIFYKSSLDGGETWTPDKRLTSDPAVSTYPVVSVSGTQVNAAWIDFRDGNYEIYYKRDPNGNPLAGVDEQRRAESSGLRLYPNPACQQLTVDSWQLTDGQSAVSGQQSAVSGQQSAVSGQQSAVSGQQSSVRLSIFDLFGRVVKEYEEIPSYPYQINISGLPDGVYILRMTDEEGNKEAVKFVKRD